jgi:hypothetical protein
VTLPVLNPIRKLVDAPDLDGFLNDIAIIVKKYEALVREIEADEKPKWLWLPRVKSRSHPAGAAAALQAGLDPEASDPLIVHREELKRAFISKKLAIRALLTLDTATASRQTREEQAKADSWLPGLGRHADPAQATAIAVAHAQAERSLFTLQQQFRETDNAYKATKLGNSRAAAGLFDVDGSSPNPAAGVRPTSRNQGSSGCSTSAHPSNSGKGANGLIRSRSEERRGRGGRLNNDECLDAAKALETRTTTKLREGLMTLNITKETATATAHQLAEGREKIQRIDAGLDEMQSELHLAQRTITRFAKRLANDKIVIAFTLLVVLGLIGIVTYMAVTGKTKLDVPGGAVSDIKPNVNV